MSEAAAQAVTSGTATATATRIDIALAYGYFHPLSGTIDQRPYESIQPGAVLSAAGYFGRHFGVQLEGGAFPDGRNDHDYTIEAGPIARYPIGHFVPFVHALGGLAMVGGPASQPTTMGWGLTGGAGVDYILPGFNGQLAFRPEGDYQFSHVDYGKIGTNGLTGGLGEIRAYRVSGGFVFRFGGDTQKARPLMYGCTAEPTTIFAGDPITVTGAFLTTERHGRGFYTWGTTGGRITGEGEAVGIETRGLAPGDYTVTGHISVGKHASENASCTAGFRVEAPAPPALSCSANPVAVQPGGQATISANGTSPQGRPLSYTFSTSTGQITANGGSAALSTAGVPAGSIHIGCRVTDDLGQSASAETLVSVSAPPAPVPTTRTLCSLSFESDLRRPTRVNNEGKACLDGVALTLNREPDARLAIAGENTPQETSGTAAARAANAKEYLITEKGIDPARIEMMTGSAGGRAAEILLVPAGAAVDRSGTTTLAAAATAAPARTAGVSPAYENPGPGTMGPRRDPNSLVLPPLPAGAIKARGRRRAGPAIHRPRRPARHTTHRTHHGSLSGTRRPRPQKNPPSPAPAASPQ